MSDLTVVCPACQTPATFRDLVPFRAECDRCAADLHVCVACRFHDRFVENECRETEADPVAHKDRRNLCEFFKPKSLDGAVDDSAAARKKLEALFGGAPAASATAPALDPAAEAKRKLEELFRKK